MLCLFKFIFRFFFKFMGWKVVGEIPPNIKKAILIAGGHTSNWDLIYGAGSLFTIGINYKFIIKQEAMAFPFKNFLLSIGAIPITRDPNLETNYVEQLAEVFHSSDECFLCIAPEGTRKAVKKWKTGYYHIAKRANVPIIVCYFDYPNKIGHIGKIISPDLTEQESMAALKQELKKARPKKPENFVL